jgi:hypothetical protein
MKIFTIVVLFAAASCFAQADLRSDINHLNQKVVREMRTHDMTGLDQTMREGVTSNFVYIENGQRENADQMIANMKTGVGMMKISRAEATIVSLKRSGNSATCVMRHSMSGTSKGPDKKLHTMLFSGISEDTYVKVGGKWKMSKMDWKNQTVKMDGKAVPTG